MTDHEIREKVRGLLRENLVTGYSVSAGTHYTYIKPSPEAYPYQFFWDTCIHAFILSALGEEKTAKKDLLSLFALQDDDGFIGHMNYWERVFPNGLQDMLHLKSGLKTRLLGPHMSAIIQPPLAAQAVLAVCREQPDYDFLSVMLPKLKKYNLWLAENRDFDGDGLLSIISPIESGMDWKPSYDPVLGCREKRAGRKLYAKVLAIDILNFYYNYDLEAIYKKNQFIVKDAGFNTIYAQNLEVMAELCRLLGDPDAGYYTRMADKVIQSIIEVMYDKDDVAFYDVYGHDNTKLRIRTPTIFYPAVIDKVPTSISRQVIKTHFFKEDEFAVPYPLPSVAVNHPSFNAYESHYLWRGPTWVLNNWFMHHFLLEKGFKKEARKMVNSIRSLIKKSGFREYYHPFTGEGFGARDFTWSGLVVDMMKLEEGRRKDWFRSARRTRGVGI